MSKFHADIEEIGRRRKELEELMSVCEQELQSKKEFLAELEETRKTVGF